MLERSGAGEGPAALPETRAAQSGKEAEPACPPRTVCCWGNFAARSGGCVLNVDGRSEFTLVYRTAQQGNGRVGGGGGPQPGTTYRDMLGKAPLRALSERQLRSSVYRRVISILRNVPPLRPFDWSQHPPWNVLIIVLPSHWGAGSMGAGFARDSLQSVFPLSAFFFFFFFNLWRGPGGGRRRVDLNVFGSPVLWPRVGSCRCWGGPFSLALRANWCPSWSPPSASSTHIGLGRGGAERAS